MLSDAAVTALIVAVPTTLASLGALIVAIVGALRSRDNGAKVDVVAAQVTEIHATTNGTLHAAVAATAAANSVKDVLAEKVDGLARELEALKLSGSLAATAATQAATDVREAHAVIPPAQHGPPGQEGIAENHAAATAAAKKL